MKPGVHNLNEIFADCWRMARLHKGFVGENAKITKARVKFFMVNLMDGLGYTMKAIRVFCRIKTHQGIYYHLRKSMDIVFEPDEMETAMLDALIKRWVENERGCCPYCGGEMKGESS
jgi:hypothetical protein